MKCNSCGKRVKKSAPVCPQCGKALAPEAMNSQELMDVMGELHNELDRIGEMREKTKNRNRRVLVTILVIIACIAAGWGAMYYFRGEPKDVQQVASEEQVVASSGVPGEMVKKFMGKNFVNVSIADENAAQTALESVKSQLGLTGNNIAFRLESKFVVGNDTYYRFAQTCGGLDVYGGEAIVLASGDGTPLALHANLTETDGLSLDAAIAAGNAANAINEYVNKMVPEYRVNEGIEITPAEKIICNYEGTTYLAYTANVSGYNEKGEYVGYDVFVDADNGSGIFVSDTASYENETKSSVAAVETEVSAPEEKQEYLSAKAANYGIYTVNDKFNWNVSDKTASMEEILPEDIESGNVTPYVAGAKTAIDRAYSYFANEHGWFGLDGKSGPFRVLLNANEYVKDRLPPEKALYSNDMIMFIEPDMASGAVDKDIAMHEYTHGVMAHVAGLSGTTAKNENAAIAESLADIFGELAEGAAPDWVHGDRDFTQVQAGYYYEVSGGVNIAEVLDCYRFSTVLSRAAYRMYADGIGTKKLGELFFRSLLTMTKYDDFKDFGTIMELNAKVMKDNGTLSEAQFAIVTTALDNTAIRGEKLYQTQVEEIPDSEMLEENEIDPNEKVIE